VPTLVLYRFRYFDPLRQRWIGARHALQAPEIRCRYSDYELIGAPEIRHVPEYTAQFNPFADPSASTYLRFTDKQSPGPGTPRE